MSAVPSCRGVVIAIALTILSPHGAYAQPAAGTDARLLALADSITVGDYCRIAQRVMAAPSVRLALASDSGVVQVRVAQSCDGPPAALSLRALRGDAPVSLKAIARLGTRAYGGTGSATFAAMDEFRLRTRSAALRPVVRDALGDTAVRELSRITETANGILDMQARDAALTRLARYERKLGPTSAPLNGIEVLLNWGAQLWVPGFRPSVRQGPSPWELVASYVPTYATVADRRAQAVSASEFGVRHYLFAESFGADGWRGVLYPTYWSVGAIVVSDRNGALVWPWEAHERTGIFAGWGATKVAYVHGRNGAWIVSRQVQIIPLVF